MAAQDSEYIKNYWTVHFKTVNFMLHELYLEHNVKREG